MARHPARLQAGPEAGMIPPASSQRRNLVQDTARIIEAVRNAATDNRLSCEAAHRIGEELKIPLREIGAVCNELKIKITACQLGCF